MFKNYLSNDQQKHSKQVIFFTFCTGSSWIIFWVFRCVSSQRHYFSFVKRGMLHTSRTFLVDLSVFICLIIFFVAVRRFSSSQLGVQTMTRFLIVWGKFLWTPSQNTNGWRTHSSRCPGFHLKTESSSTTLPIILSRYWLKGRICVFVLHFIIIPCDFALFRAS